MDFNLAHLYIYLLYFYSVQFGNKYNLKEEKGERLFARQVKEEFPSISAPQAHLKDGTSLAPRYIVRIR